MKLTLPVRAPRNPVALAARRRRAGSHRRSAGALRQQARRDLRTELDVARR